MKNKADQEAQLMGEMATPEPKEVKPKNKGIDFSKVGIFTNTASETEFPSLQKAKDMGFVSKKEEMKKGPPKEVPKKSTGEQFSMPMFTNTKKSGDKPRFTELEKQRESSGKGELTADPYKDKSREFMVRLEDRSRWLVKIRRARRGDNQEKDTNTGIQTDQGMKASSKNIIKNNQR